MEFNLKSKYSLLIALSAVYVGCLVAANTAAGKTFDINGWTWTTSFVVFPLVYIINDILAEVYGFKTTRRIVLLGFAVNFLAVVAYQIMLMIPGSETFTQQAAFVAVLGTTPRATCASFAGYLCGSTINAWVMQKMHERHGEKHLMARCVVSTLFGEVSDAAVFNLGMWVGVLPLGVILTTIITYGLGKVAYEVIVYPITRTVIRAVKRLPEV